MSYPFILTIIAGLSTLIGLFPIFIKTKNQNNIISASCSFAAGVMLCISLLDLFPESIQYFQNYSKQKVIFFTLTFILTGIFLSYIIDIIIDKYCNNSNLYKVGILSMIAIILHNIPEGIITYMVSSKNILLGLSICIAISLHNIPEGITLSVPIYYSTNSKMKAFLYTLTAAIGEPFGAILASLFLKNKINNTTLGILFSLLAGIMMQISINKLIPLSTSYNKKISTIFFTLGFIIMLISITIN